jgi:hypothetical protein
MKLRISVRWLTLVFALGFGLAASNGMAQLAQLGGSLFQQLGGSEMVGKLASSFLQKAVKDPRLTGLLGKVKPDAMSPKLSEQMCAMLGGGCKAPLSDQQIAAGEKNLDPTQKKALSENFSSALGSVTSNPLVKEEMGKLLGPKIGGIVGALLH